VPLKIRTRIMRKDGRQREVTAPIVYWASDDVFRAKERSHEHMSVHSTAAAKLFGQLADVYDERWLELAKAHVEFKNGEHVAIPMTAEVVRKMQRVRQKSQLHRQLGAELTELSRGEKSLKYSETGTRHLNFARTLLANARP
jgi:hypothetical protein